MQIFEDSANHCRTYSNKTGPLPMNIKYGTLMQVTGATCDCHTINLRAADKFSRLPSKTTKVITLKRVPPHGKPYHLRFVLMGTSQEDAGEDLLHNWLLPRIKELQRDVMERLGRSREPIDPVCASATTSTDGAGSLLKAITKWMATVYKNEEGTYVTVCA